VQSAGYWSATVSGADSAWLVDLGLGGVSGVNEDSLQSVWPVRGGQ